MDTKPFANVVYFKLKLALEDLKGNGFCKCVGDSHVTGDGKCMLCYKLDLAVKMYEATAAK